MKTRWHEMKDHCKSIGMPEKELIDFMDEAPRFMFDLDASGILVQAQVKKSIDAMIEAEVFRLPFSPIMVEYYVKRDHDNGEPVRVFAHIREQKGHFGVRMGALTTYGTPTGGMREDEIALRLNKSDEKPWAVDKARSDNEALMALHAVNLAILMLNTSGISKTVVVPEPKLNKARVKRGKAAISPYTVVSIGHVYDRSGNPVSPASHPSGRKMPIHWRAGHARMQACGEGRTQRKMVYIQPILVNYEGDGEPPKPKDRRVKW